MLQEEAKRIEVEAELLKEIEELEEVEEVEVEMGEEVTEEKA